MLLHLQHGNLDNISGSTLNGRIHRCALGKAAQIEILAVDILDIAAASHHGCADSAAARLLYGRVNPLLDSAVAGKVALDIILGFFSADAQFFAQAKFRLPINDAKVHRFGITAHFLGHVLHSHAKHLRSRAAVNIFIVAEALRQHRVLGHMSQNAQLDLRIVGGHQHIICLRRLKCLANAFSFLSLDGNILQVGLCAAQPSGGSDRLIEGGVYLPCLPIHQLQNPIYIGGFQFGQLPIGQNIFDKLIILRQSVQYLRIGGIACFCTFYYRQTHFFKQNHTQLF